MATTLGGWLSQRDSERLVGRRAELAAIEELFTDERRASVVLLHGPGGIGKSTMLREVARRGQRRGWSPRFVEARELPPLPNVLQGAIGDATEQQRPLLLIDSFECIGALAGYMQGELLPALPARAVVVIAGRERPSRSWSEGGWEGVTIELELSPLSEGEATALLRSHGVVSERVASELIAWAEGSPLALALAADAARSAEAWSPHKAVERPRIVQALIRRLADNEIDPSYYGALAVAATARVTTVELLRDALVDADPLDAFRWLASRSFTEPLGDGIALHDLVRRALYADLRERDPDRERTLRRRIADHLYRGAVRSNLLLSRDLAHLVQDEAIRWGYGWEGSAHYRIDDLAPGDADRIAERLAERGHHGLFRASRRFFEEAPKRVAVARDVEGRLCGYQVSVTPANAPSFADEHPLLGPWLQEARERLPLEAILWSESVDFTGDPAARVQAMLGMAGILRSGLENPRFAYMPIDPRLAGALAFCAALGARHLPELDAEVGGVEIQCHLIDYGEGGLLGAQRNVVYAELGLPPPRGGDGLPEPSVAGEVREALRSLALPHRLAASGLARGGSPEERAAFVRRLLEEASEQAFGNSEDERLLQRVLLRGYLDPAASHEAAAEELHLSRSAYFRRLKTASERVAAWVQAGAEGRDSAGTGPLLP